MNYLQMILGLASILPALDEDVTPVLADIAKGTDGVALLKDALTAIDKLSTAINAVL